MNDDKKPLNYWQQEDTTQHAPEAERDEPVAEAGGDEISQQTGVINWDAAEYIHLEKGAWWYTILILIALAIVAVDILWLKSYTLSVLVIVMVIALIIYSRRPPRTIHYSLNPGRGIYVGDKLREFDEFKAFGTIRDGEHYSIMLLPVKRFSPGLSVYFPESLGEQIVDMLGAHLPMENLKLDTIDIVVRKLHL